MMIHGVMVCVDLCPPESMNFCNVVMKDDDDDSVGPFAVVVDDDGAWECIEYFHRQRHDTCEHWCWVVEAICFGTCFFSWY